ncbi:MAG: site-2 protease family protein [Anaerolineae bacterium]|jgi:Zn-dependent protease
MEIKPEDRRAKLRTIRVGHVLGFPIGIHASWFTILVLLTWVLAVSYYPVQIQGWPSLQYWIAGGVTTILVFGGVLFHELGHAVVARHFQIRVRDITLFIFGGIAQIEGQPSSAVAEFWIAVAGPAMSLAMAGAFGLLQAVLTGFPFLSIPARYLAYVNLSLALFNLIPGYPLDGGRVLRAVVWAVAGDMRRATLVAANVGRGVSFLLVVLGLWQVVVGNWATGLWIAFIGWFLETAARGELRRLEAKGLMARPERWEATHPDCPRIPGGPRGEPGDA